MRTAGIIIETFAHQAVEVEHQLAVLPEVRILGRSGAFLTGLCTVPDGDALRGLLDRITTDHPGIVAIRANFVRE